jgi:hypothetical protein
MSLQTTYRGYTIRFGENDEKWSCWDIEFSHEKLSKVKERIDRLHLQLRKASSVDCLVMGGGYRDGEVPKFYEGKIVDYSGVIRSQRPGTFERVHTGPVVDHQVAVVSAKNSLSDKPSRRTQRLSEAFAPEAADMMPDILRQCDIIRDASAEIARIKAAMPRIQFDQLADLVRASEHVFTEGDDTPKAP